MPVLLPVTIGCPLLGAATVGEAMLRLVKVGPPSPPAVS